MDDFSLLNIAFYTLSYQGFEATPNDIVQQKNIESAVLHVRYQTLSIEGKPTFLLGHPFWGAQQACKYPLTSTHTGTL